MTKAEDMYIISALHEIPILTKRIEKQKEDHRKTEGRPHKICVEHLQLHAGIRLGGGAEERS